MGALAMGALAWGSWPGGPGIGALAWGLWPGVSGLGALVLGSGLGTLACTDGRTKYPLHSTGHRPSGFAAQKPWFACEV